MHKGLVDLYCRQAVASFGKQLYLADLIGGLDWSFDIRSNLLSFGDNFHWHAQLLGTESERDDTWLWAWANPSPGIAPALLHASQAMKLLGEQHGITELTQSELPLGEITGHFLSLIASGVCRADAYYRGP